MPLWIKGTTWFHFSCCAWGCQKGPVKRAEGGGGGERFSGWELCVSLWSEQPQNIHTLRSIPAEHFNSSSALDKVYIMICKVLWEGKIPWQENSSPPTRRLSLFSLLLCQIPFSPFTPFVHCFFFFLSCRPQEMSDVWPNILKKVNVIAVTLAWQICFPAKNSSGSIERGRSPKKTYTCYTSVWQVSHTIYPPRTV